MSDEEIEKPKYRQNRRLKQAKMQRQVRQSKRRLNNLRAFYKFFLFLLLIFICLMILKLPQWRLKSTAFDTLNNPALEIVNNRIVPSSKILSALRRNEVPLRPIFLVKTEDIKIMALQVNLLKR